MGLTAQLDSAATPRAVHPRQQGLPTILLALLLTAVLGTGVSVAMFFVPGAVVSGFFVAVFYALMVVVKLQQRRAWALSVTGSSAPATREGIDREVAPDHDVEEISPDLARTLVAAERAGFRMGVIIVAPLVVVAVVLAAIFVGWKIIGLGALAFFAIMLFMGGPVWLAAMEEEIDDEGEKIGVKAQRIH